MTEENRRELRAYDGYLGRRNRAPGTRAKYVQHLTHFCSWLGTRRPGDLRLGDFDEYLDAWEDDFVAKYGRSPSQASQRLRVTALKGFYRFLEGRDRLVSTEGATARNAAAHLDAPSREQKPIDFLTPAEDEALLGFRGKPHEEFALHFLRLTGVRVGEAVALTIGDLDLTEGREAVRISKSKTPAGKRTIPLRAELVPIVHTWLDHLGKQRPDYPLFATRNGTPMHDSYVWRLLKRLASQVGVRPVGCTCGTSTLYRHVEGCPRTVNGENRSLICAHTLRKTYATELLNRGVPIETVSRLLGHTNVAVTQKYYAELKDQRVFDDFNRVLGAPALIRPTPLAEAA